MKTRLIVLGALAAVALGVGLYSYPFIHCCGPDPLAQAAQEFQRVMLEQVK